MLKCLYTNVKVSIHTNVKVYREEYRVYRVFEGQPDHLKRCGTRPEGTTTNLNFLAWTNQTTSSSLDRQIKRETRAPARSPFPPQSVNNLIFSFLRKAYARQPYSLSWVECTATPGKERCLRPGQTMTDSAGFAQPITTEKGNLRSAAGLPSPCPLPLHCASHGTWQVPPAMCWATTGL